MTRFAKQLEILHKHLPTEVVNALSSILLSNVPFEPKAAVNLDGIFGQGTEKWLNKRTSQSKKQPALKLGSKALAQFDGPALGVGKWCRTMTHWTTAINPRNSVREYKVQCRDVDDEQALHSTGTTYIVFLNVTGGAKPNLDVGDVLFFFYAEDGQRIAFPSEIALYS